MWCRSAFCAAAAGAEIPADAGRAALRGGGGLQKRAGQETQDTARAQNPWRFSLQVISWYPTVLPQECFRLLLTKNQSVVPSIADGGCLVSFLVWWLDQGHLYHLGEHPWGQTLSLPSPGIEPGSLASQAGTLPKGSGQLICRIKLSFFLKKWNENTLSNMCLLRMLLGYY